MTDQFLPPPPPPGDGGLPISGSAAPESPWAPAGPGVSVPALAPPVGEYASSPPRGTRWTGKFVATIGALAVLAGGVAFAVSASRGSDGGASSPAEAVEHLMTSFGNGDLLGALDMVEPGEQESFREPLLRASAELQRLGILSEGLDLKKVPGYRITFQDLGFHTEAVGDTVSVVTVTSGTMRTEGDWSKAPLGDFLVKELLDGQPPTGSSSSIDNAADDSGDSGIATVKRGGRWYVSLWYSVAESARVDAGLPAPVFGQGVPAKGAPSPEAAIRELLNASLGLDVRRLVELTPPDEAAALHDYAPLFLDDAEQSVADLREETGYSATLDRLDVHVNGSGDHRLVGVDSLKISGSAQGQSLSVDIADKCVTITVGADGEEPQVTHQCSGDVDSSDVLTSAGLDPSIVDVFTGIGDRLGGATGIAVVQRDGQWFVSPTGTLTDNLVAVMAAVQRSDLTALRDWLSSMSSSVGSSLGDLTLRGLGGVGSPTDMPIDVPAETTLGT